MHMKGLSPVEPGRVHLYVGDGKGKTTAAVGLAVRCAAYGPVLFCQFLKARETGELAPLRRLGIEVKRAACSERFFFQMTEAEKEETQQSHTACLHEVAQWTREGRFGLIVLDEVVDAVNCGAVPEEALLALLRERAAPVEIVLTGRNPSAAVEAAADYYTDFVCKKHPYQTGTPARQGIEF